MSIPLEKYGNSGGGWLTNSITTTDTSFSVTGGVWPTTGEFHILIDGEIMVVSSVTGTGPYMFYVSRQRETTTDAVHNKNTLVLLVLSVESLDYLQTFAQFGTPISARRQFNLIHDLSKMVDDPANDSCDVTIKIVSDPTNATPIPPPQTGWTAIGMASYSADGKGVTITGTSTNIQAIFQPFNATTPVAAGFQMTWKSGGTGMMGMACRNSTTGNIQVFGFQQSSGQWFANVYSDPATKINNYEEGYIGPFCTNIYLKNDGSYWYYSMDSYNFVVFAKVDNTPDQIGFFCSDSGSINRLMYWEMGL